MADEHWCNPNDDGDYSSKLIEETDQGPWYLLGAGVHDSDGKFVGIDEARFAVLVADYALLLE